MTNRNRCLQNKMGYDNLSSCVFFCCCCLLSYLKRTAAGVLDTEIGNATALSTLSLSNNRLTGTRVVPKHSLNRVWGENGVINFYIFGAFRWCFSNDEWKQY